MKKLLLLSLLTPTYFNAQEHKENIEQTHLSFNNIDIKDFPYIWYYRDDVYSSDPKFDNPSSAKLHLILNHSLCQKLAKLNLQQLEEIRNSSNILACEWPGFFKKIDPAIKEQHDRAMALCNCATVLLKYNAYAKQKEKIDEILKGASANEQK